jgi:hypothetical protein
MVIAKNMNYLTSRNMNDLCGSYCMDSKGCDHYPNGVYADVNRYDVVKQAKISYPNGAHCLKIKNNLRDIFHKSFRNAKDMHRSNNRKARS